MALRKYIPPGNAISVGMKPLSFIEEGHAVAYHADPDASHAVEQDVDVDLREVYFLIMHFLSSGPCHRTYGQLWNELLEHQLLPRRYHAWYSRNETPSGDENDDGLSFPLSYTKLVERHPHIEKDHLVKLLKQLLINSAPPNSLPPSKGLDHGKVMTAAHVPTLLGTGSFSLLNHERDKGETQGKHLPAHMRWPHIRADQVRGLSLREIGGGFARHNRAPSIRGACYAIARPSTMIQKMQNIKRLRGHRNAVYCATFDRSGRYVITGSDDRLVKIWSMETAFCLASCRGHEGDITDLAVSYNNALVASASNDCIIRVWRLPDGLPISVLRGHTGAVTAIAFSPRPGSVYQLLSSSDDGTCRIWDARSSQISPRIYIPRPSDSVSGKNGGSSSSSGQSHQIFCCAFNASGTIFVTGSSDNLARVWNACKPNTDDSDQPNHEIDVLSGHENDVNYVQFSGCAVTSRFSVSDSSKEESIPKFRNSWFSHDNIVTCSRDGSAIIWKPRSRRSHGKVGRWSKSYHLKVPPPPMPPQPPRGGPRQRILPTPRGVNMIVWSLDNRFVLAAIMDCRICVWNAADSSLVHSLTGHTESTYVLDVHPFNPRIAMSAGYDGRTIVWDIWEGVPIRTYEISRFKLVDGKFSPDGTSIILSDDVGQLYVLSTGQGESQNDAKYDQFFLGDYRPLIQDTYGNVLDQETQLVPYRRNMQDLLCDSGMIPYPEPYQSMYQMRRLGALGMEWKPTSMRLAVGPDFSQEAIELIDLEHFWQDMDVMVEPLPEILDAVEWEQENELQSDDTDSEYNVTEEFSSGGEQGSFNSISDGDPECSAEGSEVEGRDGSRRSVRKKQKTEIEIMTSSGRRVKRRSLDECDGSSFRRNRPRKSRLEQKASKKKSSKLKGVRPQRAAARNALTFLSKISGTGTDGEEENGLEGDLSESESTSQDLTMESDESDRSLQNEQHMHSKGKEVWVQGSGDHIRSLETPELLMNPGKRRRLILKLPVRDSNKSAWPESVTHKPDEELHLVGSSSRTPREAPEPNGIHVSSLDSEYPAGNANYCMGRGRGLQDNHLQDQSEGYRHMDIRWGGFKARTSKRQRLGDPMASAACFESGDLSDHREKENDHNGHLKSEKDDCLIPSALVVRNFADNVGEVESVSRRKVLADSSMVGDDVANGKEHLGFNGCVDSNDIAELVYMTSRNGNFSDIKDSITPKTSMLRIGSEHISGDSVEKQGTGGCDLDSAADIKQNPVPEVPSLEETKESTPDSRLQASDAQINGISMPTPDEPLRSNLQPKKMFNVVYRRSKTCRDKISSVSNGGARESTSNARNHEPSAKIDSHEGLTDGTHTRSVVMMADTDDSNLAGNNLKLMQEHESEDTDKTTHYEYVNRLQLKSEEWGPSSRMTVGLRSSRHRRMNYNFHNTGPADMKRLYQSTRGSWLMLSMHEEGSRYIPQLGDEVVYLRQGHQEYIEQSASKDIVPWKKGNIKAVEFCKVEGLEYSTLAGSGDSCCKLTLKFIDPNSSVFEKTFNLTLPELTGFPDFLVERSRFDAAIERNWACRDKCKVWWKNEGEEDGCWWHGRIVSVQPKSSEFPDSPWERYTILYKSEPPEKQLHSPWELFDDDTQWDEPCIDDETRKKLVSALVKLEKSGNKVQDQFGVQKLREVSQKANFINRFSVPLSPEVIQSRLENSYYRSMEALKHDVDVMLSNAESYFGRNAELSRKMKRLSDWFERTFSSL